MSTRENTLGAAGRPSRGKKATTLEDLKDEKRTVRVNFDLDEDEHMKLKVHAARSKKTITEVLREFVTQLSD